MFDSIVIGTGIAGSVAARELAEKQHKKVLVIEKRSHIGGNCYDEYNECGVLIHKYGPHIFHSNRKNVYEYLSRFTEWYGYSHEVAAKVGDQYLPVPFNLNTLYTVYGTAEAALLEQKLLDQYGAGSKVSILELRKNVDKEIQKVADYVYENIFLRYTMKQWGQTPDEIDESVVNRVPVLLSYDNRYFQDLYQGMPLHGYTRMFEAMLNHENITVELGRDAKEDLKIHGNEILYQGNVFHGPVIYTGAIDEFMGCCYGRLPYRTLDFVFENWEQEQYQPKAVINYTVDEAYTRITEFKQLTGQQIPHITTTVKEYSRAFTGAEGEIPYYAIINEENRALYQRYKDVVSHIPNFHLLGRLAEYQYYNIDAMAECALQLAQQLA